MGAAGMVEFLQSMDSALFYFINVTLANPVSDIVMPIITEKRSWYPLWGAVIILLLWKGGKTGRWIVLIALLSVACSDLFVNRIMKPSFQRIRPCNVVEAVHLLTGKKSSFSMPSSHAANFFALAMVFSYFFRKYQGAFWFLASLVAYSRIAVGVHYPFDVLVGALVGTGFSASWVFIYNRYIPSHLKT
jgi:undecaprenyl-diphosphatase